jgi:hypothetical protein
MELFLKHDFDVFLKEHVDPRILLDELRDPERE